MNHKTDTVVRLIAPALPELTPIPLVSEADAAPRPLSPWVWAFVILLLILGLWGVIWVVVAIIIGVLQ